MENEPLQTQTTSAVRHSKSWVWVVLLVVAIAAGGATWWWQYDQTQKAQRDLTAQQAVVANAQAEIAKLNAQITELKGDPATVAAKDSELILAATDAYVRAPVAAAEASYNYEIKDNTGTFAKVAVAVTSGGYEVILKKVGDNWTVLFAGQDLPPKETGEKYGLPNNYYQQ